MRKMNRMKWIVSLLLIGFGLSSQAQNKPVFYNHDKQSWVDSVFKSLTPDDRLAQLFMVAAYSNKDSAYIKSLEKLIREKKIGGLIFFQGGPVRHATMQNYLQEASDVPLMIAMDAEWGVGNAIRHNHRLSASHDHGSCSKQSNIV